MKKVCQSCGMPWKNDPGQGGTEAGGSKSRKYCSFCYQDGAFTQPDFSVEDMQAYCIEVMKSQMRVPRPIGWLLTRRLPQLERWSR